MASLNNIAREVIDEVRDGIAWIVLWKDGRKWGAETFYPDFDDDDDDLRFDSDDLPQLHEILCTDPDAILVNSYYYNLGGMEDATIESVSGALRWQYERHTNQLKGYIS